MKEEMLRKIADASVKLDRAEVIRSIFSCQRYEISVTDEQLEKLMKESTPEVREVVLESKFCSSEFLEKYSTDSNEDIRAAIASNPNCSGKVLEKLSTDESEEVVYEVVRNINMPETVVTKYINGVLKDKELDEYDKQYSIERVLYRCSPETLKKLAKRHNYIIKIAVAKSKNCTSDVFEKLAVDENLKVRMAVAENVRSIEILKKLADEAETSEMKLSIVTNKNCPKDILRQFIECDDDEIVYEILGHPNCPEDIIKIFVYDSDSEKRRIIAERKNLSICLIRSMANDGNSDVRSDIARNPNCPLDLLDTLSLDGSSDVRHAVANNPNTRDATLYRMYTEDKDVWIRETAGANIFDVHTYECIPEHYYYVQIEGLARNTNLTEDDMLKIIDKTKYNQKRYRIPVYNVLLRNSRCTERVVEEIVSNVELTDYDFRNCLYEILAKPYIAKEIWRIMF